MTFHFSLFSSKPILSIDSLCVFNALLFYIIFILYYFIVRKFINFMDCTVLHQIDISTVSYETIFPLILDFNLMYKILCV